MAKMVDPPQGYLFGFPKEWNEEGPILEFLLNNGYPQEKIDEYGDAFIVRTWPIDNT